VGSFDQLRNLFFNELAVPGAWFCIPATEVFDRKGDLFSDKDGTRPCFLATVPGPNQRVYTRSASRKERGIKHDMHVHPEGRGKCGITKDGWIKKIPVIVDPSKFIAENFSCLDPDGPGLLAKLNSRGI